MLSRWLVVIGVLWGVLWTGSDARAERRVALVIGNSTYQHAQVLRNPKNDANDIAAALKKVGFDVLVGLDLDQQAFAGKVEQFAQVLDDADVALFFYAGHGLQISEKNYLVSVNAKLANEFLIPSETIDLEAIVRLMEAKAPTNLVFLDACRNNPLTENLKRNLAAMRRSASLGRGLARIEPTGRNTLIAFSAAPGQEAADGSERNSPFTAALLKYLPQPGLEVSVMLKEVAADVRRDTRNTQRPQQLSDMTQTFYFVKQEPPKVVAAPPPAPEPVRPPPPAAPSAQDRALEVAFWNAAQSTQDCDSIRAYLQTFPNGVFVSLARLSERRLCKPAEAAPPAATAPKNPQVAAAPPAAAPPPRTAEPARPAAPAGPETARLDPPAARPAPPPAEVAPARPPVTAPAPSPPRAEPTPRVEPAPAPAAKVEPPPPARPATPPPAATPPAAIPQPAPPAAPPPQQQAAVIRPPSLPDPATRPNQSFRDCEQCPSMITLAGGSFSMGSNDDRSEKPVRQVTVPSFALARFPVTVAEWKQCVAAKACSYEVSGEDELPVHNVSWNDAQQYIKWLSDLTGESYRLPTEAEWEYAARADSSTKFWWGNAFVVGKANCKGCGDPYDANKPAKVLAFAPNPFGLYGMTGGVAQWVQDCWFKDYTGAPNNAAARDAPNCAKRVLRGGSWKNDQSYMRVSSRDNYDTGVRYVTNGFRVARSPRRGN